MRGNWQDYYWQDASRGHSAIAELLVGTVTRTAGILICSCLKALAVNLSWTSRWLGYMWYVAVHCWVWRGVWLLTGFTGFGDMLTPTKSPTAIETERKTQSQLFARSMRSGEQHVVSHIVTPCSVIWILQFWQCATTDVLVGKGLLNEHTMS